MIIPLLTLQKFIKVKNMQHLGQLEGDIKKINSDHNIIILKVDFGTYRKKKRRKIITSKGYKEY